MRSRPLADTGAALTELGFGGASIGGLGAAVDQATAEGAIEAAWACGVRYFDTAPHYGLGLSERRMGAVLRSRPRSEYVLSTKVGRLLAPNRSPTGSDLAVGGFAVADDLSRVEDYSRDGTLRSLDTSLARLGTDRVDVVLIHDAENHMGQAIAEAAPALSELRAQGVIGAFGAGMNHWQHLRRFVRETDLDVVMLAGQWTLLDRSGEHLLDECGARGVSVLAAAPFNTGLLSQRWPRADARFRYDAVPPLMLEKAREMAMVCDRYSVSLPAAAVQFPLMHPAVVSVVAGMRSADQVRGAAEHLAADIPDALWPDIERLAARQG